MKDTFASHSFRADTFASGNWAGLGVAPLETGPLTQYMRRASQADGSLRALSTAQGSLRAKRATEECLRHLS